MQLTTRENLYRPSYRCARILKTPRSSLVLMALMALEVTMLRTLAPMPLSCSRGNKELKSS